MHDSDVLERPPAPLVPLDKVLGPRFFSECPTLDLSTRAIVRDLGIRAKIMNLEAAMLRELPQVKFPVKHALAGGMYARAMFIPKGALLIGAIHKYEHFNFAHGDISVLTEAGAQRIAGGMVLPSQPGTKRVGFAHENTIWTTVHATKETDLDKIEAELVCNDYDIYELEFLAPEGDAP